MTPFSAFVSRLTDLWQRFVDAGDNPVQLLIAAGPLIAALLLFTSIAKVLRPYRSTLTRLLLAVVGLCILAFAVAAPISPLLCIALLLALDVVMLLVDGVQRARL